MLPFLKPKRPAGVIVQQTKTLGPSEEPQDESSTDLGLHAAGQDIIRAIESKDSAHLVLALRAAIQMIQDEAPPADDHIDFDSQNTLAAKEQR